MADFCKQCTEDNICLDGPNDFEGVISEAEEAAGTTAVVLCEGCGPIQVNRAGECLSVDCDKNHGKDK